MSDPEDLGRSLDELEHQALDALDSVPLGARWTAAHGQDAVLGDLAQALADAGEDPDEIAAAAETTRRMYRRVLASAAERLLRAAEQLAHTDQRGALDVDAITRVQTSLMARPELAPALASAVESVGVSLGLDREGLAWAVLIELGELADRDADDSVKACSQAIADRLTAAQPRPGSPVPTPLRVFRSAAVSAAGPEIRARFLAADHPEHLALARALVEVLDDPAALVERFDAGRAALVELRPDPPPKPTEAVTDGPKRKFTIVHLILALIILALTVWHYVLR